jgi:hypothetical protein
MNTVGAVTSNQSAALMLLRLGTSPKPRSGVG